MTPHIRTSDDRPIYRQILDQLAQAIAENQLQAGQELATFSELAEQLAVSPLAVRKAYRGLEAQGLCTQSRDDTYEVASPSADVRRDWLRRSHIKTLGTEPLIQQLELARQVQKRLLPPARIEAETFAVAARSQPAGFVSGDFYDVIRFPDNTVGVVVGDVAGKGFSASLVMASVKTMMPFIATQQSVEQVLCELNRRLYGEFGRRVFVALAYARFDPARGRVEIANAGIPDPYLFLPGAAPEVMSVPGPRLPLGIRREVAYRARVLPMPEGARLLLYSDGIPEATTKRGGPLGYEAFQRIAEAGAASMASMTSMTGGQALGRWLDELLADVERRTSVERDDDWTALVLEARAGSATSKRAIGEPDGLKDPACGS